MCCARGSRGVAREPAGYCLRPRGVAPAALASGTLFKQCRNGLSAVERPHHRTRLHSPAPSASPQMRHTPNQFTSMAHQMAADMVQARTATYTVSFAAAVIGVGGQKWGVHFNVIEYGCSVAFPATSVEPSHIAALLGQAAARRKQQEKNQEHGDIHGNCPEAMSPKDIGIDVGQTGLRIVVVPAALVTKPKAAREYIIARGLRAILHPYMISRAPAILHPYSGV